MVKNRKLSRAISDLGWRQFRILLEGKAEKYGRDFRVISRWEQTSQICSNCGFKGGKLDLQVREWECLNCGTKHDRDTNAAINILVALWQSETLNGRGGKQQPVKRQPASELRLGRNPRAFRPGSMSNQGFSEFRFFTFDLATWCYVLGWKKIVYQMLHSASFSAK